MSTSTERTSFRETWTANVAARTLKDAASRNAEYHRAREQHWKGEEEKATTAYRESIQVREHQVTGGKSVGIAADQEKAQHLSDCKGKRDHHRSRAKEYEQWAAFFAAITPEDARLHVAHSDAAYFGLGIEPHEPQED